MVYSLLIFLRSSARSTHTAIRHLERLELFFTESYSMSSVHSENLAEQVAQLDQFIAEYNKEAIQPSGVQKN